MTEWRWPSWFALYIVATITVTLTPFWPSCLVRPPQLRWDAADLLLNAALFVPFGAAMRALPSALVVALALLFSGALELAQTQLPRTPNPIDVMANALGAWLGARWMPPIAPNVWDRVPNGAWRVLSLAVWVAAFAGSQRGLPNDFSNWQPHPLTIATSLDEGPRWGGEVSELALFDRALDPSDRALSASLSS